MSQLSLFSGSNIFVGTTSGVFLSTNDGASWVKNGFPTTGTTVTTLAISPNGTGGTNLFAGQGPYKAEVLLQLAYFYPPTTARAGLRLILGLMNANVYALAVIGNNLFAGTNVGVFLSTNNGTNWTAVDSGLTKTYVLSFAVSGTNLFTGINRSGVFLSTNNGGSWTEVDSGLMNANVYALAVIGNNLFPELTEAGSSFLLTTAQVGIR